MKLEELNPQSLVLIKKLLEISRQLNRWVILKRHENGRFYVEYAFKEDSVISNENLSVNVPRYPLCGDDDCTPRESYFPNKAGNERYGRKLEPYIGHIFQCYASSCEKKDCSTCSLNEGCVLHLFLVIRPEDLSFSLSAADIEKLFLNSNDDPRLN